jgi:biotin-(acetyl-CoA carboxylase) ligase
LGFVAGVALTEALQRGAAGGVVRIAADGADLASGGRLMLKWPNDLLFDGGKLSGILLESRRARWPLRWRSASASMWSAIPRDCPIRRRR